MWIDPFGKSVSESNIVDAESRSKILHETQEAESRKPNDSGKAQQTQSTRLGPSASGLSMVQSISMELEPKRELEHGLGDAKMELVVVLLYYLDENSGSE